MLQELKKVLGKEGDEEPQAPVVRIFSHLIILGSFVSFFSASGPLFAEDPLLSASFCVTSLLRPFISLSLVWPGASLLTCRVVPPDLCTSCLQVHWQVLHLFAPEFITGPLRPFPRFQRLVFVGVLSWFGQGRPY